MNVHRIFKAVVITVTLLFVLIGYALSESAEEDFSIDDFGGITGYTGADTDVVIPSEINGIQVTYISYRAFYGMDAITSVTLPDGVTRIANEVFMDCLSLESIHLPEGLTLIGRYAFDGCVSLESITFPKSLTKIDAYAFRDCVSLDSVFADSINAWLKIYINGPEANPLNNAGTLYLDGKAVTSVTVPDGVTEIGMYAFAGYKGLKSITLPNSLTKIGDGAFQQTGITDIIVPENVTSIGFGAFQVCRELESVKLPKSMKIIGDCAFNGCGKLKNVQMPLSLTTLEDSAFKGCRSLESMIIPDGVPIIDEYTFCGCESLENVVIPNSVKSIGYSAFDMCESLTSITIPESVKKVDRLAFDWCFSLHKIVMPGSNPPKFSETHPFNKDRVVIHCYKGSGVEEWATERGYQVAYLEPECAHDESEWIVITEPTTESEGLKERRCTKCEDILETEVLPKLENTLLPGDASDDGVVDGRDLLRLAKYIGGHEVDIDEKNASVNGDDVVDGRDLLRLAKYLGGFDVELK